MKDAMTIESEDQRRYEAYPKLVEALRWFCSRVEAGEVRSRVTYAKYKELLRELGEIT